MNRRAFLRSNLLLAGFGDRLLASTGSGDTDDEVTLDAALAGIERHRKGLGTIAVVDHNGRPVPGAQVNVEQLEHEFLFGSNGFPIGGSRTSDLTLAYRERFAALLNSATLGFFWAAYEPRKGEPLHPQMDEVIAWCRSKRITCQGTPLIWPSLPDPAWLPDDFSEIYQLAHDRVRGLVGRFQGRIEVWHVVNEPSLLGWADTRFGRWAQSAGTIPYASGFLRTARQADPTATLLVNDCLTEMPYFPILNDLRDPQGRPLFDAAGIQSHMHMGHWPLRRVQSVCDEYARLGAPLHFTEVTVLSGGRDGKRWLPTTPELEASQADYVEKLYTVLFGHPAVRAISWWDLTDLDAWKGAAAGLLRPDMSPKPAYERLLHLLKHQWWTRTAGETDSQGEFRFPVFHGRHQARIRYHDGREILQRFHWRHHQDHHTQINLPRW